MANTAPAEFDRHRPVAVLSMLAALGGWIVIAASIINGSIKCAVSNMSSSMAVGGPRHGQGRHHLQLGGDRPRQQQQRQLRTEAPPSSRDQSRAERMLCLVI